MPDGTPCGPDAVGYLPSSEKSDAVNIRTGPPYSYRRLHTPCWFGSATGIDCDIISSIIQCTIDYKIYAYLAVLLCSLQK